MAIEPLEDVPCSQAFLRALAVWPIQGCQGAVWGFLSEARLICLLMLGAALARLSLPWHFDLLGLFLPITFDTKLSCTSKQN